MRSRSRIFNQTWACADESSEFILLIMSNHSSIDHEYKYHRIHESSRTFLHPPENVVNYKFNKLIFDFNMKFVNGLTLLLSALGSIMHNTRAAPTSLTLTAATSSQDQVQGAVRILPSFSTKASVDLADLPPVDISALESVGLSFGMKKDDDRSGIVGNQFRWPRDINFQISASFSKAEQDTIYSALRSLSGIFSNCRTVGLFPQNVNPTGDYVFISNQNAGCGAVVGRRGGRQTLNLGPGCVYQGTALHEMIHAIGFHHEQIRPDRDSFVKINWENIQPGTEFNFRTSPQYSQTYEIPYDYFSIMHYGERAFSRNGGKTVEAKSAGIVVGSRGIVTDSDRIKIRAMYSCPA